MAGQQRGGILNKTLGEVLQNNSQAQGMIMQSMQITPEKFQELLKATGNNQIMNMTIGDLFKNGVVQQAVSQNGNPDVNQAEQGVMVGSSQLQQISPEQFQQIVGVLQNGQPIQQGSGQIVQGQMSANAESKPSFFQRIKNFFS
jgi:hypothetical protein